MEFKVNEHIINAFKVGQAAGKEISFIIDKNFKVACAAFEKQGQQITEETKLKKAFKDGVTDYINNTLLKKKETLTKPKEIKAINDQVKSYNGILKKMGDWKFGTITVSSATEVAIKIDWKNKEVATASKTLLGLGQKPTVDKLTESYVEDITSEVVAVDDVKVALEAKFDELTKKIEGLVDAATIEDILPLMSECQAIRVNPEYNLLMKKDASLLKKFKQIRDDIRNLSNKHNLDGELESRVKPDVIKETFRRKLVDLTSEFYKATRNAGSFEDVFKASLPKLKQDIKVLIQVELNGLLEASKVLSVGESLEISKSMTEIRSSIANLSETLKLLQELAKSMADMAAQVTDESTPESTKRKLFKNIEEQVGVFQSSILTMTKSI